MLIHAILLVSTILFGIGTAAIVGFRLGTRLENYRWKQHLNNMLIAMQSSKQRVTVRETKPFVIITQSGWFCDYIADAVYGHDVPESTIRECIEPYTLDDRFTIVFDLNGKPPRILPNSEKGQ